MESAFLFALFFFEKQVDEITCVVSETRNRMVEPGTPKQTRRYVGGTSEKSRMLMMSNMLAFILTEQF
jgi:hypothetical protein